jgi:hypothetical protein
MSLANDIDYAYDRRHRAVGGTLREDRRVLPRRG